MEHHEVESGDVGLAISIFGVAVLVAQSSSPSVVRAIAALSIILSFGVVTQLTWAFILPRIPETVAKYNEYKKRRGDRFTFSILFWLIPHYPLRAIRSQFWASISEHTEIAYLTLLALEWILGSAIGVWSIQTLFVGSA